VKEEANTVSEKRHTRSERRGAHGFEQRPFSETLFASSDKVSRGYPLLFREDLLCRPLLGEIAPEREEE
jgi:hypothetical protein